MRLFSDSIGRKAVMAVTGLLMVLFVIGHLLGNLTIFNGPDGLNSYAYHLHGLPPVVWATRIVMGTAIVLHVILSIQITLENNAANPIQYAVKRSLRATFASKNMIWTGLIIAVFVGYHLAHFTFQVAGVRAEEISMTLGGLTVSAGDVRSMVVAGLQGVIGAAYVVATVALFLHLLHGIQSLFQTLGLSNAKLLPQYGAAGKVLSTLFLIGFGAIPAVILVGLLK